MKIPLHAEFTMHIPSIMCKENCVKSVREALISQLHGIDVIDSDPTHRKTVQARYDLQYLAEHVGPSSVSTDPRRKTIQVNLEAFFAKIKAIVAACGHEVPSDDTFIQNMNLTFDELAPTHGAVGPTSSASAVKSSGNAMKKGPTFSETLMQHPVMKGLQAATMLLMMLMIPIMLSAIYIVLSRPFHRPTSMAGM